MEIDCIPLTLHQIQITNYYGNNYVRNYVKFCLRKSKAMTQMQNSSLLAQLCA